MVFYQKKNEPKKNGAVAIMERITIYGKLATFSTKLEIQSDNWDLKHDRVLAKSYVAVNTNNKLDKVRGCIVKIYAEMMKAKGFATSQGGHGFS